MGPRSHERGNCGFRARHDGPVDGFNGAAFSRTRKRAGTFVQQAGPSLLQWGRVLTNAETAPTLSLDRTGHYLPCFERLSFIIIDPAGMVPLVALRRTKKPGSARAGTCRDHAINGPRSWTTQSRGTPAIDAQRLNWLRRRRAIRSGGGAHPLAATRRLLRSVMVGA